MNDPVIEALEAWYAAQCDGEWEHSFGLVIETLDNPGFSVTIDLTGTNLANRPFSPLSDLSDASAWIQCTVENGKFKGHGGPRMLGRILSTFIAWSRSNAGGNAS